MEIKESLLMPKTNFEMRGNLPTKEPGILDYWNEIDLYNSMLMKNKDNKHFVLHDGPPYANGNIHIGHALNKCLKDFVIRYKSMSGFYTPYIPGWDTHGLPIESALQKSGVNRKEMAPGDFKDLCKEYALKQVEGQKAQFIRLGSVGDYSHPYLTLQPEFEARQIEVFATMVKKGLIFKGLKPVYWSPSSESALAEAEVEYKDITSKAIYFKFPIVNGEGLYEGASYMVWTTTPWTLPCNLAVAAGPTVEYVLFNSNKGKMLCASELLSFLTNKLELENVEILDHKLGSELLNLKYRHPLYEDRICPTINADYVTTTDGTGFVHIAPGYGAEDYVAGKQYGLDIMVAVDSKGYQTKESGKYEGLFYADSEDVIINDLRNCGSLLLLDPIMHSYPHDWRTHKPVIFRATSQWFATLEPIRQELLDSIETVSWASESNKIRLYNMIKERGDWCISRQRLWGVPLPIFYAEDGTPIMSEETLGNVAKLFREHGSNIWSKWDVKDLLPKGFTHPGSPNGIFTKENDIMDVWFDSGSSHTGVLVERGLDYPSDLYLEGSDQYRGWFNSSLIIGVAVHGIAPYKAIVSHGFVVDGKGQKMSKSLGNTIDPQKVVSTYGADILRLWAASIDYTADAKVDDSILKQVSDTYRKIRNTFRFILGNLNDFDYEKDYAVKLENIDEMILNELNKVTNEVVDSYDKYNFAGAVTSIMNFMTTSLSAFYLDIIKDSLYCDAKKSLRRKQIQTVLYCLADRLVRMLAPVLCFTTEEIAKELYKDVKSVHLLDFPKKELVNSRLEEEFERLFKLRSDVLKALEESRQSGLIGSAQEALVYLQIKDENVKKAYDELSKYNKYMMFIVSEVIEQDNNGKDYEVSKVEVVKHTGEKCERCWNRFDHLHDNMCDRCHEVFDEVSK